MDNITTFNLREYAWGDVQAYLFGQPVAGLRGIEYKLKQATEVLFAAGRTGRSVQRGKIEVEGTLTITQSELDALNRTAIAKGYPSILGVDFDIVVSYAMDGIPMHVDRIVNVAITELPKTFKEGDMFMEVALPFVALGVKYGV